MARESSLCRTFLFQFLYGAIGSLILLPYVLRTLISIPLWCDWKSLACACPSKVFTYFNSSMVRLEVSPAISLQQSIEYISIPLWCDWKDICRTIHYEILQFQFLYGAIGSQLVKAHLMILINFNSSMVRLEVKFI